MNRNFTIKVLSVILLLALSVQAQAKKLKVLFLGNSYTYVNNMPQIVANIALAMGDTLTFESNSPGGQTFQGHNGDPVSTNKIKAGGWDYVVLQEQSQRPSFPQAQVANDVYPFAKALDALVDQYNSCGQTMFYMTWGRKNGDAGNCPGWPPVCTYQGMDSLLQLRYMEMALDNKAEVSPVAAVWRYLRKNNPGIELYDADESHPSPAGSYAAAVCFYTAFFRKDPATVTYNFSISANDAASIRTAVKKVVYDSFAKWHIGEYGVRAAFSGTVGATRSITFNNTSTGGTAWNWSFGDGNTSTQKTPTHTYAKSGVYNVKLVTTKGACKDSTTMQLKMFPTSVDGMDDMPAAFRISPNPATDHLQIRSELFLSAGTYRIQVYNMMGQEVLNVPATGAEAQTIDISHLHAALYTLQVSENGKVVSRQRIIKN